MTSLPKGPCEPSLECSAVHQSSFGSNINIYVIFFGYFANKVYIVHNTMCFINYGHIDAIFLTRNKHHGLIFCVPMVFPRFYYIQIIVAIYKLCWCADNGTFSVLFTLVTCHSLLSFSLKGEPIRKSP